jgi:16S rRNA processing protein RimM
LSNSLEYIRIGKLAGAHGLDGRLKVLIISDIDSRFETVRDVFVCLNGFYRKESLTEFEPYKNRYGLIKLKSVNDKIAADQLSGCDLFITKTEAEKSKEKLDTDTFYYYDLIDCDVILDGNNFGKVENVIEAGAGEILIIEDENGKEFLIPFVESMVDVSMLNDKKIVIMPAEGLLEEQ